MSHLFFPVNQFLYLNQVILLLLRVSFCIATKLQNETL